MQVSGSNTGLTATESDDQLVTSQQDENSSTSSQRNESLGYVPSNLDSSGSVDDKVANALPIATGVTYELIVIQQPQIAAALSTGRVVLGRLPILPACIVELIIRTNGIRTPIAESNSWFCSCSLKENPGIILPVEPRLIGGTVKSVQLLKELVTGNEVGYFIFDDVGVSSAAGNYQLEFVLGETKPDSRFLARVDSINFNVVASDQYPGRPAANFYTDLNRNLKEVQGVNLYVPATVVLPANHYTT